MKQQIMRPILGVYSALARALADLLEQFRLEADLLRYENSRSARQL
jgi:hypothetical protein